MHCAICYHLYHSKNVKNTHGGVLLLVKLQTKKSVLLLKVTLPRGCFSRFLMVQMVTNRAKITLWAYWSNMSYIAFRSRESILSPIPANIYLFKVNNRNTRKMHKKCSKLTRKTPDRRQWRRFSVFIVNLEHISHFFLVFQLLTLIK